MPLMHSNSAGPQDGANVVSLFAKQSERSQACNGLECYWYALRGTQNVPRRADIEPRGMGDHLRNSFIAEKTAPGLARIRVAGTALQDLQGMELRGMPLSYLIDATGRDRFAETVAAVFSGPKIARLNLVSPRIFGRSQLRAQMILLPLMDDFGQVSRLMGAIETTGRLGPSPRHFLIDNVELKEIGAHEIRECVGRPQPQPDQKTVARTIKPYLRVVSAD